MGGSRMIRREKERNTYVQAGRYGKRERDSQRQREREEGQSSQNRGHLRNNDNICNIR